MQSSLLQRKCLGFVSWLQDDKCSSSLAHHQLGARHGQIHELAPTLGITTLPAPAVSELVSGFSKNTLAPCSAMARNTAAAFSSSASLICPGADPAALAPASAIAS
jgi:hypothetical protein